MARTEVHKFGGTSLADAGCLARAADILGRASQGATIVAVASAMGGATDALMRAACDAADGHLERALEQIERLRYRHTDALALLSRETNADPGSGDSVRGELVALLEEVSELLRGVALIGELSPRVSDRILSVGEKLSVRLLAAALGFGGFQGMALDADSFLDTDDAFGDARPLTGVADRLIQKALRSHLEAGRIPVVTGFCGRAPDGATTTLGRGGSDLSATLLGAATAADEVTIWTDVAGVFSADPAVVPDARVVGQLNYREASEMSYYGAKVLHQRTIIPVADLSIPVRIKHTFDPSADGTLVDGTFTPGSHPVKALSAVRGQCLLSVEGKGMAGVPGVAARMFGALAARDISITMISQSSSESTICIALPREHAEAAEALLKSEFRPDLTRGDIEEVVLVRNIGIIAAVGLGMAHTPGVSSRLFTAMGDQGVNVRAIAQGSSELNISFAVEEHQVDRALRAAHAEFGLHRADTGRDSATNMDIMLLGCGRVGRALAELILDRASHVFDRFSLSPEIVAMCDRTGYLFDPTGIPLERVRSGLEIKKQGASLVEVDGAEEGSPTAMVERVLGFRVSRPVLVDVSDADGSGDAMLEALRLGADVVTANKKPLAGSMEAYRELVHTARERGRLLKCEATVGAGLPVVDTLDMLLATGDAIRRITGCFSGTLGYIMSELEAGAALSDAVAEAARRGYTEPDPVDDLSGLDVARKAIILARLSGILESDVEPELEGLVADGLAGLPLEELLERIRTEYDGPLAERVEACAAGGRRLRYGATIEPDCIRVGLIEVAADSPLFGLQGSDNMIVFESERYADRPLAVSGPGAGLEVTAMGVLSDVLRIAAERR
ncbi:MAG: aspartate kinase [Armatimonadia bacterium]|nr:aspartate kinase [Armatimonadia bacterium]